MTQWTSLLEQHAAAARPRPFDGVVRRVRRRRQRQVVGAALGVLLVVGGAALAVGRPTPAAHPRPAATSAPDTIVVNGKTLHRDTLARVLSVRTASRDDHLLTLVAGTRESNGPSYCYPWTVPYVLSQTDTTVVIGAQDYVVPRPPGGGCFLVGLSPATLTVDLGRALGGRTVIDKSTGSEPTLLVAADFLSSTGLPAGYRDPRTGGGVNPGFTAAYLAQTWTGPGGASLDLVEGPPAEVIHQHVQHVGTAQVRGREGQLVRTAGGTANRCLRWDEGPGDSAELCTRGYSQQLLTVAQLVSFAESLHRAGTGTARSQAPATIEVQGKQLRVLGAQGYAVAYLDPSHPRDLVVHQREPGSVGHCSAWPVLRVVSQTADQVELGLFDYQVPHPVCMDYQPEDSGRPFVRVTLDAPLGGRRLLDVGSGSTQALVIDPTDWLTAGYLPPGFSTAGQQPFDGRRAGAGDALVVESWAGERGLVQLTLEQGQALRPGANPVSRGLVRGHQGTYSNVAGQTYPVRCLSWLERANDRVVLCSHGGGQKHLLPDTQLLKIAEAMRPRTM